jgi:hypothetical protein
MSIHLELAAMIDAEFADQLAGPLERARTPWWWACIMAYG